MRGHSQVYGGLLGGLESQDQVLEPQAAKLMAKIGFLVLINMFKGRQMKIEGLLAAIAH